MARSPNGMRRRQQVAGQPTTDTGWIERLAHAQESATVGTARALTYCVVAGWWDAVLGELANAPRWSLRDVPIKVGAVAPDVAVQAREIGTDLARLPVGDANGLVGRLYTRCLPANLRASTGVFYTPPPLVRLLLDRAEEGGHRWDLGNVIDPSCGGGAFLVPVAERIMLALEQAAPAIAVKALSQRITGWELDPFAAWVAQVSLDIATLPVTSRAGTKLGSVIKVRDSLKSFQDGEGKFDLVVGNPPFGKVKDNEAIRSTFRRSLYGHPNLYGLFTDLAVHLAKPKGGRIAYLTPGSFLAGHYFKRLRELLAEQSPPVSLDFVTSRRDVFEDVLQEVVLSTYQRGRKSRRVSCRSVVAGTTGLETTITGEAEIALGGEPWILPRSPDDGTLVAAMAGMPSRLADWGYKVSTGPLVWNRHKDRLHDRAGAGRVPVIWAEAVQRNGKFNLDGARRGHRSWFSPRAADKAMLVDQPCVLVQRTTATEQHRRLISAALPAAFIRKHGKITVENHLNMVVATSERPAIPPDALARFLASGIADRVLRCINASVAVSASELEAMPLPSAAALLTALKATDPEGELMRLYGQSR